MQGLVGSPEESIPGTYAKSAKEESPGKVVYAPALEVEEPEARAAKVAQNDWEERGGSGRCPGCNAIKQLQIQS